MVYNQKNCATKIISVLLVFSVVLPSTVAFGQTVEDELDYYYEGQAAAQRDYTGGGAMGGGVVAGTLLGLIGWGLGYLIISNQNIEVPRRYVADFSTKQRMEFEDGYKATVKKTRNGKYNMGAGVGTLIAVAIVMSASE
mgnify:FL=1|jgi:hypothetical protein